jgi:hypothetical protein
MAKIPETYQAGITKDLDVDKLYVILMDIYKDLATAINQKPDLYVRSTNGQTTDTNLSQGSININSSTLKIEMLSKFNSSTAVTWTQIS